MSDDLEWEIKVRSTTERTAPGKYEAVVRQGGLAGWAIRKTEQQARSVALARLRLYQADKADSLRRDQAQREDDLND